MDLRWSWRGSESMGGEEEVWPSDMEAWPDDLFSSEDDPPPYESCRRCRRRGGEVRIVKQVTRRAR